LTLRLEYCYIELIAVKIGGNELRRFKEMELSNFDWMPKNYEYILFAVVIILLLYVIIRLEMLMSHIKYQQLLKDLKRKQEDPDE
jgi:hypothetical protein